MPKFSSRRVFALGSAALLLLDCSGGLPEDDLETGGAQSGSAGQAPGGTVSGRGGAHQAGSLGSGASAGKSTPSDSAGAAGGHDRGSAGEGGSSEGGSSEGGSSVGGSSVGGSGGGSVASAGAADICGLRRCDSDLDNDCNGTADDKEASCECSQPNALSDCSTGYLGACAPGKRKCVFAADGTQSAWGQCTGSSAGPPDCRFATDLDCNGIPDNTQNGCTVCAPGAKRACETAALGSCKPGSQACVLGPNNASVQWETSCASNVAAKAEACGPQTPDDNCNGIGGDGDYKLVGSTCATTATIAGASRYLFKAAQAGTVAVHLCVNQQVGGCPVANYVALSCGDYNQTDTVIGYASTSALPNYAQVAVPAYNWTCMVYVNTYLKVEIPAFSLYVLPP
ncbi:MAG TPA: hypothetical protein VJV79_23990 [Polyangiaceae bacterium]|nr:hypothetical protein [Polyangiaceae bacterium]